ncbi:MAG: hypothetical protein ACRCTE_00400, partial [Cellulosilyticaceae bacterium]
LGIYYKPLEEYINDPEVDAYIDSIKFKQILKITKKPGQKLQWMPPKMLDAAYIKKGMYHPIQIDNRMIGGSKDRAWFDHEEMVVRLGGQEQYREYKLLNGQKLRLAGAWEAIPRQITNQGTKNKVYADLYPYLTINGNYRMDLEGDGETEVILSGRNHLGMNELIVRKIVGGKVQEWELSTRMATSETKLVGVADLNGDGVMEIIYTVQEGRQQVYYVWMWDEQLRTFYTVI